MGNDKIIIEPSDDAHWYLLIKEAHDKSDYGYNEQIENYLVITLKKYATQAKIAQQTIALRLLSGLNQEELNHQDLLREVGDECLVLAGLFPHRSLKHHLPLSYYIHAGQSAYSHYANKHTTRCKNPELFDQLSTHFIGLMDILQLIRAQS